jgi:hypothetical protein
MSQQKKLEQILDFLVNEDVEKAEELLHDLVVEKARNIYEELVNEEDEDEDDMDEAMDESIGGDMKQDFTRDVRTAKEDIEADELQDGEVEVEFDSEECDDDEECEDEEDFDFDGDGEFDDHEEEHMDVEDKVEDLEAQLEELRAEFEQLMAAELEEPHHDAEDFEVDGEAEMELEPEMEEGMYVGEATKLQDAVPSTGQDRDAGTGKLVGTGKQSKSGKVDTKSTFTDAPAKSIDGAKPVDFGKGKGGQPDGPKGGDSDKAKDDTPSDNIDVNPKDVNHGKQDTDGDFVGTGSHSKKGATNTKSPLSTAPKKP